ncbi:Golgi apparatus protein 1-like [Sycon ciliatum]|uniref:Golgi apparatus protein 1-like n=1 Tax=Sycon ciliatum TaxID=27933 RepID=UPI0031F62C2D
MMGKSSHFSLCVVITLTVLSCSVFADDEEPDNQAGVRQQVRHGQQRGAMGINRNAGAAGNPRRFVGGNNGQFPAQQRAPGLRNANPMGMNRAAGVPQGQRFNAPVQNVQEGDDRPGQFQNPGRQAAGQSFGGVRRMPGNGVDEEDDGEMRMQRRRPQPGRVMMKSGAERRGQLPRQPQPIPRQQRPGGKQQQPVQRMQQLRQQQQQQQQQDQGREPADDREQGQESENGEEKQQQQGNDYRVDSVERPAVQAQHPAPGAGGAAGPVATTGAPTSVLAQDPECHKYVTSFCPHITADSQSKGNFRVLFCLQQHADRLSSGCHKVLWNYKLSMTKTWKIDGALGQLCGEEMKNYCGDQKDRALYCLSENLRKHTSEYRAVCKHLLRQAKMIVFSDYRLVEGVVTNCSGDITKFSCERIAPVERDNDVATVNSQGKVLECLENHIKDLTPACRGRLLKKEEQSNWAELDRPLFHHCTNERQTLCATVEMNKPGNMFTCLELHQHDPSVSQKCLAQIKRRSRLIAMDFEVANSLVRECAQDLTRLHCHQQSSSSAGFMRLFSVLRCLSDGNTDEGGQKLKDSCLGKVRFMRQRLMGDKELSPELVEKCKDMVDGPCAPGRFGENAGKGVVVSCLIEAVANKSQDAALNDQCSQEVLSLIKVANPAKNVHIDHVLEEACRPVIDNECPHSETHESDKFIVQCLMSKIDDEKTPSQCRRHLFGLQFFFSRDINLTPRLAKVCDNDIAEVCHTPTSRGNVADPPAFILSCLYRAEVKNNRLADKDAASEEGRSPEGGQAISRECKAEVHRALARRAHSAKMNPALQEDCMAELGKLCADPGPNGDIRCLSDKMEEEDVLSDKCKAAMRKWSAIAVKDVRLNRPLFRACASLRVSKCRDVPMSEDGAMSKCLVDHVDDAEGICKGEILRLAKKKSADVELNFPFKSACKNDLLTLCGDQLSELKTTTDAMRCLKEKTGIILKPGAHAPFPKASPKCQKEIIRQSRLEVGHAILNVPLFTNCKGDIHQLCLDKNTGQVFRGEGKVMDCLVSHRAKIQDPECQRLVGKKAREIFLAPQIDFKLQKYCGDLIAKHCSAKDLGVPVKECLRNVLTKPDGGPDGGLEGSHEKCREVLHLRAQQSAKSWKLKPRLANACLADIRTHCLSEYQQAEKEAGADSEGIVISCLRRMVTKVKLADDCKKHILKDARLAAKDYRLSARLKHVCREEVMEHCGEEGDHKDGTVLKCLRQNLKRLREVKSSECLKEVINLVVLVKMDIHTDPTLFQTCIGDLRKFCALVRPGDGRLFSCLHDAYVNKPKNVTSDCREAIADREGMWKFQSNQVDSVKDMASIVMKSKSRVSLTSMFACFVLVLFFIGCMSGRRCRFRRRQEKKSS